MTAPVAVVLAAGKSTRMKSALPKVLHEVCGRPMIEYVLDAARAAGVTRIVVIVGHAAESVRQALAGHRDVEFAVQAEQKGTGHAVMMCREALATHDGPVLILTGDAPLMKSESFAGLLADAAGEQADCVIGTATTVHNFGLGRIVRGPGGEFLRIVEEKDASPEEKAIQEINVGCYVVSCQPLFHALDQLRPNNKQGEYYLTDVAAILKGEGRRVVASPRLTYAEALGVNTRQQLAQVQQALLEQCLERHQTNGVTILAPHQTYIDPRAKIGADTVIHPFSVIEGAVEIGAECRIGPHAVVHGPVPAQTVVPPFTVWRG